VEFAVRPGTVNWPDSFGKELSMILRIRITTHVAIARINAISKTIAILMKIMVNSYKQGAWL
jgi:hypothetical protein